MRFLGPRPQTVTSYMSRQTESEIKLTFDASQEIKPGLFESDVLLQSPQHLVWQEMQLCKCLLPSLATIDRWDSIAADEQNYNLNSTKIWVLTTYLWRPSGCREAGWHEERFGCWFKHCGNNAATSDVYKEGLWLRSHWHKKKIWFFTHIWHISEFVANV